MLFAYKLNNFELSVGYLKTQMLHTIKRSSSTRLIDAETERRPLRDLDQNRVFYDSRTIII